MKTIHAIYTIIVFAAATSFASAQNYPDEYLGLPGDNLNLYAVMNLFQESETLEKFEQNLNSEDQMINNLDLNGDNLIDYITVSDYVDGNVHNIVLRAALNRNEQQDVAVFVVESLRNGAVQIQLIGDEALYGPNYIVEPIYAETPNPGYTGKTYRSSATVVHTTYYDIAAWPVIRFIYRPGYVGWHSSWYWGYYPSYWRPWRAHYWHYYYGYHYHWHDHYYSHYRHWDHYRCGTYQTYYHSKVRVYSPTVVVNVNNGRYRNTYSRPDQRREGENYYARTASSRARVSPAGRTTNATVQRSSRTSEVQRNQASRNNAVQRTQSSRSTTVQTQSNRSTTVQRNQPVNNRNAVQRGSSTKTTPAVQRSQSSRSQGSVQRSSSSSSSTKTTPAVQRSQPGRSQGSVQRSSSSSSSTKTTPAVQRSQPGRSQGSVQRSSSSSNKKATPAVQRSQPGRSQGSVQRSSSSSNKKATPAVQRSQPSKSKSAVQRSSSSSSSKKSTPSRSSSSASRR